MRVRRVLLGWSCLAIGLLLGLVPAHAEAFGDCVPIGTLENFEASAPPQTWVYASETFRAVDGNAEKDVERRGKTCLQHYALKDGAAPTSDLEIVRNYEYGLPALGFRITNTNRPPDGEIFATMTNGGVETWAHIWPSNGNELHILVTQVAPFQPTLAPAVTAADCPPIRALRDFAADNPPQNRTYAAGSFGVFDNGEAKTIEKSGATCLQHYALKDGTAIKSDLEIIKNYADALPQEGWSITNTNRADDEEIFATQTRNGVESWLHVWPSNGNEFHVLVLRVAPFQASLVPVTALDCAPIRGLRDFAADSPPQRKPYDAMDFTTVQDGQATTITKTGNTCRQDYSLKSSQQERTDLEIITNYATALPLEGWTITNPKRDADAEVFATQTRDGAESWVHIWPSNGNGLHIALLQIAPFKSSMKVAQAAAPPQPPPPALPPPHSVTELTMATPSTTPEVVKPDQGDFPYLPPVPGSRFISGKADPAPFFVQPSDAKQPELVANGSIVKLYQPPPGLGLADLLRLYQASLLQGRWTTVSELHDTGVLLSVHYGENGRNIWAALHLAETDYSIRVADATIAQGRLAADLKNNCHLALTGVLFDFDKSSLKPESDAILRQVAALMAQDAALNLEIQGHTDNVGSDAYNQPLSEARAHSVVVWLNGHGVGPGRLTARGYGKTRPVASNATEEGRAQNRRVEIANPACKG